jgi:hypothetical protein
MLDRRFKRAMESSAMKDNYRIYLLTLLCLLFLGPKLMSETKKVKKYYVLAQSGLSVREEPALKSKKLGILKYNSNVEIVRETKKKNTFDGITDNWVEIKYNDKKGYIFSGFLCRVKGPKYNIRSLKKYVDSNYKKVGKMIHEKGGSEVSEYERKIYKYTNNVVYTEFSFYESGGYKLAIPQMTFREAFLIAKNLDSRYKKLKYKIKKGVYYQCYYEADGCTAYGDCVEIIKDKNKQIWIIIGGGC